MVYSLFRERLAFYPRVVWVNVSQAACNGILKVWQSDQRTQPAHLSPTVTVTLFPLAELVTLMLLPHFDVLKTDGDTAATSLPPLLAPHALMPALAS